MAGVNTRNWKAWIDLRPPGPPALHVIGEVEVSQSTLHPKLGEAVPQGSNPAILILDLAASPGNAQYVEVRFDKSPVRRGQYSNVQIRYEGDDEAFIDVEETH